MSEMMSDQEVEEILNKTVRPSIVVEKLSFFKKLTLTYYMLRYYEQQQIFAGSRLEAAKFCFSKATNGHLIRMKSFVSLLNFDFSKHGFSKPLVANKKLNDKAANLLALHADMTAGRKKD